MGALLDDLAAALPPGALLVPPIDARFHGDWSGARRAEPVAVALPASTDEVAAVLRACSAHRVAVVPQGGRTGLAGGATPGEGEVVLALERLRGVESLDSTAGTMTVRAGTVLAAAQEAATAAGWELAYDLGARGSCQIGGTLATNAGGNRVIRYGMARQHVLGLEVVLADGTVLDGLSPYLKDNAGYDLKQWFLGSEGTLGVITRAVLRLHPATVSRVLVLFSLDGYDAATELLRRARAAAGVTAFEVMWPYFYRTMTTELGVRAPLPAGAGMYALVELSGRDPSTHHHEVETLVASLVAAGTVRDAAIASCAADTAAMWTIREGEPMDRRPAIVNFDVSVAIADIGRLGDECERRILARWPGAEVFLYGHAGDGNLHLSVELGVGSHDDAASHLEALDDVVYDLVREHRGSISAEHGIGTLKRRHLGHSRSEAEIEVMRRVKHALDPLGILNPGKILA